MSQKIVSISEFISDMKKLTQKFSDILPEQESKKFLLSEMESTIARTTKEAQAGKDSDGKKFRKYSAGYIAMIKAGRARSGNAVKPKSSTSPNLTISGELMTSRRSRYKDGMAEGYFDGDHSSEKGKLTNASLAQKLDNMGFSNWNAFGKKDITRINEAFRKLINAALNKIGT